MNITETISLLDELRTKATHGEWRITRHYTEADILDKSGENISSRDGEQDAKSLHVDDAEYIVALHNNYEALRQAALDGERYRKAAGELVNGLRGMPSAGENDFQNVTCFSAIAIEEKIEAYRQAVEQKEV